MAPAGPLRLVFARPRPQSDGPSGRGVRDCRADAPRVGRLAVPRLDGRLLPGELLLPMAAVALPTVPLRVLAPPPALASPPVAIRATAAASSAPAAPALPDAAPTRRPTSQAISAITGPVPGQAFGPSWFGVAVTVWIGGLVLLLLRQLLGLIAAARLARSCEHAAGHVTELAARSARRIGLRRRVDVGISAHRGVPVACGLLSPAIVLPKEVNAWPDGRLDAVLTHELAHCARFDALTDQIAQLATSMLWWHPLAWLALRRARLDRECACDDLVLLVLSDGRRASEYAEDLVGVVETLTAPAAATLGVGRRSQLEHRIRAILDVTVNRRPASHASLGVGIVFVAAGFAVAPTCLVARTAATVLPRARDIVLATGVPTAPPRATPATVQRRPAPEPEAPTPDALAPQTSVPPAFQAPQEVEPAVAPAEAKWRADRAAMFGQLLEHARSLLQAIHTEISIGTLAYIDSTEPEQTLTALSRLAAADPSYYYQPSFSPSASDIADVKQRFADAMHDLAVVETQFSVGLSNPRLVDAALMTAAAVLRDPVRKLPAPEWDAPMSDVALIAALKSAPAIAGDANRADALLALARHNPFSPEMVALYVAAANSITSDAERARVFAQPIRVKPPVETPIATARDPSGFERIVVAAGRSLVLTMTFDIRKIAITNPAVAEATGISPRELRIDGKSPGTISLIVWGDATRVQYDVEVDPGMRAVGPRAVQHDHGAAGTTEVSTRDR